MTNITAQSTYLWALIIFSVLVLSACSGPRMIQQEDFQTSETTADNVLSRVPMYTNSLTTLKGNARAIVSEPGNTERVRVNFSSDRDKSLVSIKNNLGIEGGQLLTDGDTLLIYNKVDKFARKIPVRGAKLDRINRIASLNIIEMLNYTVSADNIESVLENRQYYMLILHSGTKIHIDKESYLIEQVDEPPASELPYSKIRYDAYGSLKEFKLPRRITIFGPEGDSKVDLQITSLELNPKLDSLVIELPEDIPVYHQ